MDSIKTLARAAEAIEDSILTGFYHNAMIFAINRAFDGGETGIDAWAEPAALIAKYGNRRENEAFRDLIERIDLDAIAAEGKSVSIGGDA